MKPQSVLSVGNFFGSAHFFLIIYVLAPYLATFMPAQDTGLVVSFGAILTLVAFPFVPRLVAKYGAQTMAVAFALLEGIFLVWLSVEPAPIPAMLFAALACATAPFINYQLDLMLEATVTNEGLTGRVRTAFLTAGNAALLVTPVLTGVLLDGGDMYGRVFLAAALSLVPFIVLMVAQPHPHARSMTLTHVREAWSRILGDRDLRAVAGCMAVLQFFYHLAPIYIPLYLHTALGLPWSELGWIFAVMLAPYVLVEYPAGVLADTKYGDRVFLFLGFLITGLAFTSILFIHADSSIALILCILIASRLGSALVEAMVESHFFRRVTAEDAHTVSVFRTMRPVGALIAPLVGSMLLSVAGYGTFFVITGGLISALGLLGALAIKDRRYSASA